MKMLILGDINIALVVTEYCGTNTKLISCLLEKNVNSQFLKSDLKQRYLWTEFKEQRGTTLSFFLN